MKHFKLNNDTALKLDPRTNAVLLVQADLLGGTNQQQIALTENDMKQLVTIWNNRGN